MKALTLRIDGQIRDEKLQYNIKIEAVKISAFSIGNIDKYEFLIDEYLLSSYQSRIIEQAKFRYSSLGNAFEKEIKAIEDQGIKQVEAIKALKPEENQKLESIEGAFPNKTKNNEIKNETDDIKKREKSKRKDLVFTANINMVFNNMKRQVILVKVCILIQLIQIKLKSVKAVYQKIWQNLINKSRQKKGT